MSRNMLMFYFSGLSHVQINDMFPQSKAGAKRPPSGEVPDKPSLHGTSIDCCNDCQ
jgi:hypothetical protein